jgi:uncharacterized protein YecE (DUF72 family)
MIGRNSGHFLCFKKQSGIHEWLEEGKTVYVYFNNTMGDAIQNLITLNTFVQQAGS